MITYCQKIVFLLHHKITQKDHLPFALPMLRINDFELKTKAIRKVVVVLQDENLKHSTGCFKKSHHTLNLLFQKIFVGHITLNCYFHKILLVTYYSEQLLY